MTSEASHVTQVGNPTQGLRVGAGEGSDPCLSDGQYGPDIYIIFIFKNLGVSGPDIFSYRPGFGVLNRFCLSLVTSLSKAYLIFETSMRNWAELTFCGLENIWS